VGLNPKEVERALDMPVSFQIESDREVPMSVNRGVPLALANPRASIVKALTDVADALVPPRAPAKGESAKRGRRRLGRS
jgi:pilus assembly protein CpaE